MYLIFLIAIIMYLMFIKLVAFKAGLVRLINHGSLDCRSTDHVICTFNLSRTMLLIDYIIICCRCLFQLHSCPVVAAKPRQLLVSLVSYIVTPQVIPYNVLVGQLYILVTTYRFSSPFAQSEAPIYYRSIVTSQTHWY